MLRITKTALRVAALSLGVLALVAPAAAHASQRPVARPAVTYPYNVSRIASTGSKAVIAATDRHGDLYYFWQPSGTSSTWHKQLVASATSSHAYAKPSITLAGTTLYIAAVDSAGNLFSFTKTGTGGWDRFLVGSAKEATYKAPSIAAGNGYVLISADTGAGQLVTFELAPGGTGWTEQVAATGHFGPSSITIALDPKINTYLGLLTASSGGSLYFWFGFPTNLGWIQQLVAGAGAPGTYTGGSITTSATNVVIAAADTSGQVESFVQPFGASGWTEQAVSTSGGPYTSPQAATIGNFHGSAVDVITAADKSGNLHYWWAADQTGLVWQPEIVAAYGTRAVYANPGIGITSAAVVITAINTKPGNVMYWSQTFGTNLWPRQLVATG